MHVVIVASLSTSKELQIPDIVVDLSSTDLPRWHTKAMTGRKRIVRRQLQNSFSTKTEDDEMVQEHSSSWLRARRADIEAQDPKTMLTVESPIRQRLFSS